MADGCFNAILAHQSHFEDVQVVADLILVFQATIIKSYWLQVSFTQWQ